MTSQGFPFPFLGIGTVHEAEAVPVTPAPKFQFVSTYPIPHLSISITPYSPLTISFSSISLIHQT